MKDLIGKGNASNLVKELNRIAQAGLPDYRLIGSIGFNNIADKTWRLILEQFPIERVMNEPDESFRHLEAINGIGFSTIDTILKERPASEIKPPLNPILPILCLLHRKYI
jgi:endonuclease III-like uncharacterized protein